MQYQNFVFAQDQHILSIRSHHFSEQSCSQTFFYLLRKALLFSIVIVVVVVFDFVVLVVVIMVVILIFDSFFICFIFLRLFLLFIYSLFHPCFRFRRHRRKRQMDRQTNGLQKIVDPCFRWDGDVETASSMVLWSRELYCIQKKITEGRVQKF